MQHKIKIAGNDLTSSVRKDTIRIESVITRRVDTCKLTVEDTTGSISISPNDEIIISNVAESIRYFAGYIGPVDFDVEGITKLFRCEAQDYTILPDTVLVNEVYEDKTHKQIIDDLFSTYLSEIDTATYTQTGPTIVRIVFNRTTLRQALDKLALLSGYDWYIDYNKKLHYFAAETNVAPFGLSDAPDNSTTYPYSKLKYSKDPTEIVNLVQVVGGYYKSDDTEFELPSDGQTTELLMPYRMHKPDGETALQVWQNDGNDVAPNWTELTVGIDYIDNLTDKNVLHNYQEKLIKFATAPPDLTRSVKIKGQYNVPILVRVRSETSYIQYGRWFEGKVIDKDIDNVDWGKQAGKGVLAKHAFEKERGELVCTQDGLVSGQSALVVNGLRSIDGYYMINKLVTRFLGGTVAEYTVSFGEYNPDLVDLIIAMKARAVQYQEIRDDETLIELLERFETLTLAEAPTRWEQPKGQYCWGPKTNGGDMRVMVWDFFTWG